MKTMLEVYIKETTTFEESKASTPGGTSWTAPYLYKKVKELELEVELVNLRHINLSEIWSTMGIGNMDIFLYHSVRIQKADLRYPIIMSDSGFVMDGCHRVAKAILEGKKTIKAYRFESYVEPDVKGEDKD